MKTIDYKHFLLLTLFLLQGCVSILKHNKVLVRERKSAYAMGFAAGKDKENQECQNVLVSFSDQMALIPPQSVLPRSSSGEKGKKQNKAGSVRFKATR